MTEQHLHATRSPDIRTPMLVALLLSASMLAGCASNPVPEFSYDESVPPLPGGFAARRVASANATFATHSRLTSLIRF